LHDNRKGNVSGFGHGGKRGNAAVVSSELARKLYMTEDIIGNRLVLGDKKYKM